MARSKQALVFVLLSGAALLSCSTSLHATDITARLFIDRAPPAKQKPNEIPSAVIWLKPLRENASHNVTPGHFTLVQKNKTFTPHLLVIPLGSSVAFPNTDPFFHNVFSLFDGRRFDLGLYEAGSTRSVVFSREGVSYVFCNIHSEMSAVVITLNTPFYSIASQGGFRISGVPEGDYDLHIWIDGQRQNALDKLTRQIHVTGESIDLGEIRSDQPEREPHRNKFDRPYDADTHPIY